MSNMPQQKNKPVNSKSLLFGLLIGLCLLLSATSVYVKHRLDLAEQTLSAPDSAFAAPEKLYEDTIVALGYGGFLGSAQQFMNEHDREALRDMRMHYKTAQEALLRVGDKASTSVRRDMRAILDMYADIITKAENTGSDALSQGLTSADLITATSALSTLENRLSSALAVQRVQAQADLKAWSLSLLLFGISGFVLSILLCMWSLWTAGGSHAHDLETLAQSVTNLVHGDIHKPVWGIDRDDKVGELARTIDLARMYFTQIPDVSVIGEDGPIRLKFDGESRSLFQAMMKKITETYERTQQSSLGMTGSMKAQQDMLRALVAQMQNALDEVERQGKNNNATIETLADELVSVASHLVDTQEKGTKQFDSLIPMMKERVHNMAEITHLAGQQVTSSLQSLIKSESSLRNSAARSQQTLKQLSQSTNLMGERMFAALNLMQATSKALNDTIDSSQTRFNEAVSTLTHGEKNLTEILSRAEQRLAGTVNAEEKMAALATRTVSSAEKLEKVVDNMSARHDKIDEQIMTAAHRMDSIVANFDSSGRALTDAAAQMRRDGTLLGNVLSDLRDNNNQLLEAISENNQSSYSAAQSLAEKSHALMQRLEVQIDQQAQMAETRMEELSAHGQNIAKQATNTTSSLAQSVTMLKGEQEKLSKTRTRFTSTLEALAGELEKHATNTFGKTEKWAADSFERITSITEQMESFMARLNMLGQLTGTLGTVAGQLGQLVPALTSGIALPAPITLEHEGARANAGLDMEETKTLLTQQTETMIQALAKHWHEAVVQIEAMHDQLAQIVVQQKDQLDTRLTVMDKKLREATDRLSESQEILQTDERQAQIIESVIHTVSQINEHVLDLEEVVQKAGLQKTA